jgi:hypothetical protein
VSFLGRLLSSLVGKSGPGGSGVDNAFYYYVRCARCREVIRVRVDRANDLAAEFDGNRDSPTGYTVSKGVVGKKCFRTITLTVLYDGNRRESERSIDGGEFVTVAEYEADQTSDAPGA